MENPQVDPALEVLKSLSKAMRVAALYQPGHPAVASAVSEVMTRFRGFWDSSGLREFSVSIDQQNYIVNGNVAGQVVEVPTPLKNFFDRLRLDSLTFDSRVDTAEIEAILGFGSSMKRGIEPEEWVKTFEALGLKTVRANTARYAKVGEEETVARSSEAEPDSKEERERRNQALIRHIQTQTLETSIWEIIRRAVSEPEDQKKVYEILIQKLKKDLEKRVEEATETLRGERDRLAEEMETTQKVLGTMAEGVVTVDGEGNILMMNEQAERMTGKRLLEAAGAPILDEIMEGQQVLTLTKDLMPDAPDENDEVVVKDDESTRILRASTAIVRDEKGKLVGTMSTMPDLVKLRELQQMQREFVSQVTHELRSPLTAIQSALDLLTASMGAGLGKDERKIFDAAIRNTEKLGDLISHILDFSKIESGRMAVRREAVEVRPVILEAVHGLEPWARVHQIELRPSMTPGLPDLFGDKKRMIQILTNLISNAIKASADGSVIDVAAKAGEGKDSGKVVFSVADRGVGIPEKDRARIFDKFFQTGSTRGGTGLGLVIVKNLVDLHGGRIWVESKEGKGTTFFFTIEVSNEPRPIKKKAVSISSGPVGIPAWKRWVRDLLGL